MPVPLGLYICSNFPYKKLPWLQWDVCNHIPVFHRTLYPLEPIDAIRVWVATPGLSDLLVTLWFQFWIVITKCLSILLRSFGWVSHLLFSCQPRFSSLDLFPPLCSGRIPPLPSGRSNKLCNKIAVSTCWVWPPFLLVNYSLTCSKEVAIIVYKLPDLRTGPLQLSVQNQLPRVFRFNHMQLPSVLKFSRVFRIFWWLP